MAATDKVCFDRVLPTELQKPRAGRMIVLDTTPTRAAFQIAKLWPNGSTLRLRFLGGSANQHALVKQHAAQWAAHANLKFEFVTSGSTHVRIAFNDDGAWSYIGTDALGIPADQPTMNYGWLDEGVILHEFGHMLGMIHEHQNPRNNPIQWNKPAVNASLSGSPNFWDQQTIDHNMYAQYEVSQINGSALDPKSVMLYSFPASWTLNGFHTEPNESLSAVDKEFAKRVYPRGTAPAGPVELSVFEGTTEANIGQPGEEDLYKFTARTAGRYTVETEGPTDLVMNLFGPGGNLVAQDDDSGPDRNPQIVTNLTPGSYVVQVRHYNAASGTGRYAIKVSRG